jgi:DNA polymerase
MQKIIRQHLELLKASGIDELYLKKTAQTNSAVPIPVSPSLSHLPKADRLAYFKQEYRTCTKCPLHSGRKQFVYGEGNPDAIVMVIGEAPGEQENLQGRPFVGPAGQLLDKMLIAIHIKRDDAYIANIVKCRPPGNRNPENSERESCLPYLLEQIEVIQPKVFLMMGLVAAQTLLQTNQPMHILREGEHRFMDRPAFVTYHPSALLRNPDWKKNAWIDLQRFQIEYEKQK